MLLKYTDFQRVLYEKMQNFSWQFKGSGYNTFAFCVNKESKKYRNLHGSSDL